IFANVSTSRYGLYVLMFVAILYVIARGIGRIPSKILVVVLGATAGVLLYFYDVPWLSVHARKLIAPRQRWSYSGVAYLPLLAMVLVPFRGLRDHPERRTLALVALLILAMVPIGSGRILFNAHYGMWLAIGVIGTYAFTLRARDHAVLFVQVACAVMVVTYGVLGLWRTPYRDTPDRTQLTHAVHHPKLRGIFTNQLRAQTVQH